MQHFKTQEEKTKAVLDLAATISVLNKRGTKATHKEIGSVLETQANNFSPSANHFYREALETLLKESFIGKTDIPCTTNKNHKPIASYRLLKPMEDIEAFFASFKWDRRHTKTKEKQDAPYVKKYLAGMAEKPQAIQQPKTMQIDIPGVKITFNF